jgi:5-methylcytosine-specific restriction endonuclease McrA
MKKPTTLRPTNQPTRAETKREAEARRESATERGYDGRWRKARLVYLAEHPLCVMCETDDRIEAATVVDHIQPHRGDQALFWDVANWQSLCRFCHDRRKQSDESRAWRSRGVPKP